MCHFLCIIVFKHDSLTTTSSEVTSADLEALRSDMEQCCTKCTETMKVSLDYTDWNDTVKLISICNYSRERLLLRHFQRRVAFILQSFNSSLGDLKSKVSSLQSTDEGKGKLFDGVFGCGLVWEWTVRVKQLSSMINVCNFSQETLSSLEKYLAHETSAL